MNFREIKKKLGWFVNVLIFVFNHTKKNNDQLGSLGD